MVGAGGAEEGIHGGFERRGLSSLPRDQRGVTLLLSLMWGKIPISDSHVGHQDGQKMHKVAERLRKTKT